MVHESPGLIEPWLVQVEMLERWMEGLGGL